MLEEKRETIESNWTLAYDSFEPAEEGLREALTSTGNGCFCTRGTLTWAEADRVSYPGTYTHGGYNRETTIMAGVPVLNEDLVNLPTLWAVRSWGRWVWWTSPGVARGVTSPRGTLGVAL